MKEDGAVVGLPLYILITVVVAAVALAAILSFMITSGPSIAHWDIKIKGRNINDKTMYAQVQDNGYANWTGYVEVWVYDQNGHPLPGVKVVLEGCGITAAGTTNKDGYVNITLDNVRLPPGVSQDDIKITLSYPGLVGEQTKTDTITVIRNQ